MLKKIRILIILLISLGAVLTYLYFKYWQEPEAIYIMTDNPKLLNTRKSLEEVKSDLKKQGLYSCCIRNDCNWCALYMGHCPCAKLISAKGKEKSCPECAAAWNRKQGKIPGVDPDAIEVTTFGIYGIEKGGHHHPEETGHHAEREHH